MYPGSGRGAREREGEGRVGVAVSLPYRPADGTVTRQVWPLRRHPRREETWSEGRRGKVEGAAEH